MSIRWKLIQALLLIGAAPMILVGALGYHRAKQALEAAQLSTLASVCDLKAKKIDEFIEHRKKQLDALRSHPGIAAAGRLSSRMPHAAEAGVPVDAAEFGALLITLQTAYHFTDAIVAGSDGKIIYTLSGRESIAPAVNHLPNLSATAAYKENEIIISDAYITGRTCNPIGILFTAPIVDAEGALSGWLSLEYDFTSLYDSIQDASDLGRTGETLIAKHDENAALVLNRLDHSPSSSAPRRIPLDDRQGQPIGAALSGKDGHGFGLNHTGKEIIAAWRHIPSSGWGMVVAMDTAEALQPITGLRNFFLFLMITVVLLCICFAVLLARSFARPIHLLQRSVEEIGKGNLDHKVGTVAKDEIGALGRAFDQMTEKLKAVTATREELNREISQRRKAQEALQESEERFRDLVENSLTGISIVQDNQVVYQNREQERILGPLPRPYILADLAEIHPDDVDQVSALTQRLKKDEIHSFETEFRYFSGGANDMKWLLCRGVSIEINGLPAMLVNLVDMTRSKELENLLTVQEKMASLGRVAAGIAHEIRNPLSGINIYLDTLCKLHHQEGSEEKVASILRQMNSASRKIESVIRRVMDFAKPSDPRLALMNINGPISEAIQLTEVTLRKSGIRLMKSLAEDLPPVYADRHMIEELVLNLINNAAEAIGAERKDKVIEVRSELLAGSIVVAVSDSGPGIAPRIRDKIFDPYFTTKPEGTGIGLSLCHRIMRDHGGLLSVGGSAIGGAEFRASIPVVRRLEAGLE